MGNRTLHFVTTCLLTLLAPGLLLALSDLVILAWHGIPPSLLLVTHVVGAYSLLALVGLPLIICFRALCAWRGPNPLSPAHVPTLVIFSLLGVTFVLVNRDTFAGQGLRTSGQQTLVEGISTAAGLVFIFLLVFLQSGIARQRFPKRPRDMAWPLVLVMLGLLATVADRRMFRGQYPQVHLQLLFLVMGAWGCASFLLTRNRFGPRTLNTTLVGCLFLSVAACVLPHMKESPAIQSQLATTPGLAIGRVLDFTSPVTGLFRPAPPQPASADDPLLQRVPVDRAALEDALASRNPSGAPSHTILITIDTVRFDHVGFLGYERKPTTPNWDALADRSTVFENAYTPYPTSNWAFSSLLTSRWADECPQRHSNPEEAAVLSLATLLKTRGFHTAAATALEPSHVRGQFNTLPGGFDEFSTLGRPGEQADANVVADAAIDILRRRHDAGGSLFLWVHFFDPHAEYIPRVGFDFGTSRIDRYDSEIAHADAALGRLMEQLEAMGYREKSIIIVHSDHGEAFGEHGNDFHNSSLYEEQIHVPLTISVPGGDPMRVSSAVSLVDVLPTVLSLHGIVDPHTQKRRGRDLAPLLLGLQRDGQFESFAFSQLLLEFFPSGKRHALITDGTKTITTPRGFPSWEVYDLERDPSEQRNVFGENPVLDARMTGVLEHLRKLAAEGR